MNRKFFNFGGGAPETGAGGSQSGMQQGEQSNAKESLSKSGDKDGKSSEQTGENSAENLGQKKERELTLGEQRVGRNFNPSGDARVDEAKAAGAYLIDKLNEASKVEGLTGEQKRLFAEAMTRVEDATMWSVKAYTKK